MDAPLNKRIILLEKGKGRGDGRKLNSMGWSNGRASDLRGENVSNLD